MTERRYRWVVLGVICLMGSLVSGVGAQGLRLSDFLGEMVALEQLRTLPDPWYQTVQFASYDRRSEGAYQPGWYANSDGFGNEPIPNVLEGAVLVGGRDRSGGDGSDLDGPDEWFAMCLSGWCRGSIV